MSVVELWYQELDSPVGPLKIVATERGVCHLSFGVDDSAWARVTEWSSKQIDSSVQWRAEKTPLLAEAALQLQDYFAGKRMDFTLPLDLYGTEFQTKVWHQLCHIPFGQVQSYKEVAIAIGSDKAVRAVGGANNKNPLSIIVPCHRVIGADGALVGYGGGLPIKEYLLELEKTKR